MAYTTIDKPELYFNTKLYTGTGSELAVTGVGFQPDFVWSKNRQEGEGHRLFDSVRGATKFIRSNNSDAEGTAAQTLKSFDSDGVTIGTDADMNTSSEKNVLWNWLAGGSASSNSNGTITSSVSASTTAGFSVVSYTSNGSASQTVGHGLGAVPQMIISKNRDSGSSSYNYWTVYHHSLATANDKKLKLNTTDAASSTNEWGDTDPTSTVYSVHTGGDGTTNHSSDKIIAYCFAEKKGYSKFGSYTGNGNSDGTFVYTGFRPAWFLVKRTDGSDHWTLWDNKRETTMNPNDNVLYPSTNGAESSSDTSYACDFLSNGIKWRGTSTGMNTSGGTYIYIAFAESPFVNSNGVPTTAR